MRAPNALRVHVLGGGGGDGGRRHRTWGQGRHDPRVPGRRVRPGVPGRSVTAEFATQGATAKSPSNYAFTNGELTFAPGEKTKQVAVTFNGDKTKEKSETFHVLLFNVEEVQIFDGAGLGTIKNDDRKR
jgi:hypothetical protein